MDVVSAAASIAAIVEVSAKVSLLCIKYYSAVKDAKKDILRLRVEVDSLRDVLQAAEQLFQGPDSAKLLVSQKLYKVLKDCLAQLATLKDKLDPGKTRKIMSTYGFRALRWPFDSKEIDKVIRELEKWKQTVSLALQIDQA
jgi:hypothetical protein